MNVSLIINPAAGNKAYRSLRGIEEMLKEEVSFTTCVTQKKGDAFAFAQRPPKSDLIIVAGGDGTFNEVINGLLSSGEEIPLAFLPLGTTNVLAKELGIPEEIKKAVALAITGIPKKISLGRINKRFFSLMAGIGFDGEAVFRVKNNLIKRISGKGAYILSGTKTLIRYNPSIIKVRTSKGEFEGYSAVIGKASCYGGYFQVTPEAKLTEPLLDLCLFKGRARSDMIRYINGVIKKRHLNFEDVMYGKFSELEVTSTDTVHIQIDGDYFGTLPAEIDVVPDAVSLIW